MEVKEMQLLILVLSSGYLYDHYKDPLGIK